jgi:alpha-1,2-mannosyltransferase
VRDGPVQSDSRPPRWLTAGRIRFYAFLVLLVNAGYFGLRIWFGHFDRVTGVNPPGWDFAVFWSASWLALHGPAVNAFDTSLIEPIALPLQNMLPGPFVTPWAYPPTFLLVVLPAALLPFWASYLAYFSIAIAFALRTCACIVRPVRDPAYWLAIFAFPAFWAALAAGQNSFLTFGFLGLGLACLERRPWIAGILFGLLAIKPQLGLVIPVALLFSRNWRAIASAALTTGVFCALAGRVLGFDTFTRFAAVLPAFNHFVIANSGQWPRGISTVFGVARHFGVSVPAAALLHAAVAAPAVGAVAWLWATRARFELRASALVLATLLVPNYLLPYDLLLLGLPILWLMRDGKRHGWIRGDGVVMVCAWLSPAVAFAPAAWPAADYVPLFIVALFWVVVRRGLARHAPRVRECDRMLAHGEQSGSI